MSLELLESRELLCATLLGDHLTQALVGARTDSSVAVQVSAVASSFAARGAPAVPSVTVTAVSATQINLSWSSVAGANGYRIEEYVADSGDHYYWKLIGGNLSSGTTSYSVTGLSPGTTYYFAVAAFNGSEISWTNPKSATTLPAVPAAPTFTATPVSTTQINLSWKSVAGANGYEIDELVNGVWKQIGSVSGTSYSVTGLSPGTTYSFKVAAFNVSGTTWANVLSTITYPAAPTFTPNAVSYTEIDLSWNRVTGASGYLVDEWVNGAWVQIASLGSGSTGFPVTGLSDSTTYYFDVAAVNSSGTTWANWLSASTGPYLK